MLGAFPSLSMLSTEGNRCCTSSFLMFYFFLSKSWLLLFLNVASLLAKVKLRPVHRHPSYLPHVTGIPRVLDHLLDPEARGFSWRRNCHCALNLAPNHFPSLSFSHRHCDLYGFDIDSIGTLPAVSLRSEGVFSEETIFCPVIILPPSVCPSSAESRPQSSSCLWIYPVYQPVLNCMKSAPFSDRLSS